MLNTAYLKCSINFCKPLLGTSKKLIIKNLETAEGKHFNLSMCLCILNALAPSTTGSFL